MKNNMLLRYIYRFIRSSLFICIRLLTFFGVKRNKVLFLSYYGKSIYDNPGYIHAYLKDHYDQFEYYFAVNDEFSGPFDSKTHYVKYGKLFHLKLYYHICTSKVIVNNCRMNFLLLLRKNQFYIQTWHGGGAQKKCEKLSAEKLEKSYVSRAISESKKTDLFISESRFITELYHSGFWFDGAVYECGYPRYDILLQGDFAAYKDKVYAAYRIDPSKKIALYAPTFRIENSASAYSLNFERLLQSLKERFASDFVILVRLHPNLIDEGIEKTFDANVINASKYPDSQELLAAADVLIGDYSSINYDFALTKKPVFRFLSDLEAYNDDRGLCFPVEDYPYPFAVNDEGLNEIILNFDYENYLKKLDAFHKRLGAVMNPEASKAVAELIASYIKINNKKRFFAEYRKMFVY